METLREEKQGWWKAIRGDDRGEEGYNNEQSRLENGICHIYLQVCTEIPKVVLLGGCLHFFFFLVCTNLIG